MIHFDEKLIWEEVEWRESLDFSLRVIAQTFPDQKNLLQKKLRREIEQAESDLKEADKIENMMGDFIYCKIPKKDEWWWQMAVDFILVRPLRIGREQLIRQNTLFLLPPKKNNGSVTEEQIIRAKQYPINQLLEFRGNVVRCLWHNEKTPSLHYYKKTNTCYCWGTCKRSVDAIDVYMTLHNCSFTNAVTRMQ